MKLPLPTAKAITSRPSKNIEDLLICIGKAISMVNDLQSVT